MTKLHLVTITSTSISWTADDNALNFRAAVHRQLRLLDVLDDYAHYLAEHEVLFKKFSGGDVFGNIHMNPIALRGHLSVGSAASPVLL